MTIPSMQDAAYNQRLWQMPGDAMHFQRYTAATQTMQDKLPTAADDIAAASG
jgi:hypothetical protein